MYMATNSQVNVSFSRQSHVYQYQLSIQMIVPFQENRDMWIDARLMPISILQPATDEISYEILYYKGLVTS